MIPAEELLPLLRERLAAGQTVRYLSFRGVSMLPLLRQGKDAVELAPLPPQLRKYDLPVYVYPGGKVVMHRILAVREEDCICLGDNTYEYEYIRRDQMIGLVTAIRRGNRRIPVTDPGYRCYCRLWVGLFPLRRILARVKKRIRRLLK